MNGKSPPVLSSQELVCLPMKELLSRLGASVDGLSAKDAHKHLHLYGHNELAKKERKSPILAFLAYFNNPLILILLAAGAVAGFLGEIVEAITIFIMVLLSVVLSFVQEHRAERAAEDLRKRVATTATVLRDGVKHEIHLNTIVPGDVVFLSAGDIVPADARIIEAKDLFVDQAALTGESFPAEKQPEPLKSDCVAEVTEWRNYLFMGTSVVSGTATALIVRTGGRTQYGETVKLAMEKRPETEFDRGLRQFGYLIMQVTIILVVFVFIVLALLKHDVLESVLFALALAVGLTPELLPMIVSINLSMGAVAMSGKKVIVKRLSSIHNFGAMDVLCSDKTGTLTENRVTLIMHVDLKGKDNARVLEYSFVNSAFQTAVKSPLDLAVMAHDKKVDASGYRKIDEIPFDFNRRRSSVVAWKGKQKLLITKGAPEDIAKVCDRYELEGKVSTLTGKVRAAMDGKYRQMSMDGYRVLGICCKEVDGGRLTARDEQSMTFLGFIAFIDPPKASAREAVDELERDGIMFKILTGDSDLVTRKTCEQLGIRITGLVTGADVSALNDDALARVVEKANIFARVTPAQKNRILHALKGNNHVVGFLGDGINDAPSMRVADVSMSVENAVDVAKESADIILLQKDLRVLEQGVLEGRKTFGNTMKYIMMGVSSNFGNMLSVAVGSLFLPFLPMLPIQILLNNLLYDFSETTIPTDNVDKEYIQKPRRMKVEYIRRFMLFFGPISSIFDILTYLVMLFVFNATAPVFQTAWFVESLCTQTLIIFAIRTRRIPFLSSLPSVPLALSSIGVVALTLILPFTPLAAVFEFAVLPVQFFAILAGFVVAYLILVEMMKWWFYRKYAELAE
ncbi:MAG: magnesium-translocating P-type ATPase [Candidatus ainarchaeum sp.]|nr:magnesium-translocating P-type ATPase [Candidatus ainarchaeum sp.]